jgi:hypothetical protein
LLPRQSVRDSRLTLRRSSIYGFQTRSSTKSRSNNNVNRPTSLVGEAFSSEAITEAGEIEGEEWAAVAAEEVVAGVGADRLEMAWRYTSTIAAHKLFRSAAG